MDAVVGVDRLTRSREGRLATNAAVKNGRFHAIETCAMERHRQPQMRTGRVLLRSHAAVLPGHLVSAASACQQQPERARRPGRPARRRTAWLLPDGHCGWPSISQANDAAELKEGMSKAWNVASCLSPAATRRRRRTSSAWSASSSGRSMSRPMTLVACAECGAIPSTLIRECYCYCRDTVPVKPSRTQKALAACRR